MKRSRERGETLIEMALVAGVSVMIAVCLFEMVTTHLSMLNRASQYRFLSQDAPVIGLLLAKTMANADDYRIYDSRTDALALANATTTGTAIRLWMRQANDIDPQAPSSGSTNFRQAIISYETYNGNPGLYFFLQTPNAGNVYPANGNFPTAPSWQMAGSDLTGATFANDSAMAPGILLATLSGSNNEQIIYAAEKK
jgi:hypothetical protein